MEFKARLKELSRDWITKKFNVTFEILDGDVSNINSISEKDLKLTAVKFTKKRSLNANALMWECIGKIAQEIDSDKWDVYLMVLKQYGKYTPVTLKAEAVEDFKKQWRECEEVGSHFIDGQEYKDILCYFGSSTLNTQEFSHLLDGVISEMKAIGLQTPGQQYIERSLEAWNIGNQ